MALLFIVFLIYNVVNCAIILIPTSVNDQRNVPLDLLQPQFAHYGSTVTLICKYKLKTSKLNSVKWYKDEKLFLEFLPNMQPQIKIIQPTFLNIDESKADMHEITLSNVTSDNSGNYQCSVDTENANNSIVKTANLTVFAYPERDPIISTEKSVYSLQEKLIANCSSGKTIPPTVIVWFLDGIKVDRKFIIKEEILSVGPYYRTLSTINVKLETDTDKLILGCVGRLFGSLPVTRTSLAIPVNRSLKNHSQRLISTQKGANASYFRLITLVEILFLTLIL